MYKYAHELRAIEDPTEREDELSRRIFKLNEHRNVPPFRYELQQALQRLKAVRLQTGGKVTIDDDDYCSWSIVTGTVYNFFTEYMGLAGNIHPAPMEELIERYPGISMSLSEWGAPEKSLDDFAEMTVKLLVEQVEHHGFAPP